MEFKDKTISIAFSNDKVPDFEEKRGADWIKYGEENNYPQFLVTLFNRSAIHNSILTSKQLYISGEGFTFDQTDMSPKDIAKLKSFVDSPNEYETLNDLTNKFVLDEELFGGFYIHGISTKNKKGIASIYHLDYCSVRSNLDNTEFYVTNGEDEEPGKTNNWVSKDGTENSKPKFNTIPAFNPDKKQKEWVYYYKSYRPNLKTYTLPSYIGGVEAIITDCEIANFHRANIQNSFKGSKMIIFKNGVPTDEEMQGVERKMKSRFTPTDKAGGFVIDFVDDPQRVPEILNLGDDQFDKKYAALDSTIESKIFKSHKITSPILFGVTTPGALGQRNELVDAFHIFTNTYIKPKQLLHERVIDLFAPVKGKLKIQAIEPIMPTFGDATLATIMSRDEMREKIGMPPDESKIDRDVIDQLNVLNPRVALPVINSLMVDELRRILGQPPLANNKGQELPSQIAPPAPNNPASGSGFKQDFVNIKSDKIDFMIFSKYGEKIENFSSVKVKKQIFSKESFADLDKIENGILDLIKKTPEMSKDGLQGVLKINDEDLNSALEALNEKGLVTISDKGISASKLGNKVKTPSFTDVFIRYRYVLRDDAPELIKGGESRDFCKAMINDPRYFSKNDIESIGQELGDLYGISNYDAFKRRGGWYHDPKQDVNVPYCRHAWQQELVKRIK